MLLRHWTNLLLDRRRLPLLLVDLLLPLWLALRLLAHLLIPHLLLLLHALILNPLLLLLLHRLTLHWAAITHRLIHLTRSSALGRLHLLTHLRSRTNRRRGVPIRCKPLRCHRYCRTPLIHPIKLLTIRRCSLSMLHLHLHRRNNALVIHRHVHGGRPRIHSLRAVETVPSVIHYRHIVRINIPHRGYIYPVHLLVVIEVIPLPISAVISRSGIAKPIVNTAVEADM